MLQINLQLEEHSKDCSQKNFMEQIQAFEIRKIRAKLIDKTNGRLIQQGFKHFKFSFDLEISKNFSVNSVCHVGIEEGRIFSQTSFIDYRVRKFIEEIGHIPMLYEINRWNMQSKLGSKFTLIRNKVMAVAYSMYFTISHIEKFIEYLEISLKQFKTFFQLSLKTNTLTKINKKPIKFKELDQLKQQLEKTRISRPKSTQQKFNQQISLDTLMKQQSTLFQLNIQEKKQLQSIQHKIIDRQYSESSGKVLSYIEIEQKNQIMLNPYKINAGYNSSVSNYYFKYCKFDISSIDMNGLNCQKSNSPVSGSEEDVISNETDCHSKINSRKAKAKIKIKKNFQNLNIKKTPQKDAVITKIECQSILVQKKPLLKDPIPFKIQLQAIKYLKDGCCPSIASYYFNRVGYEQFMNIDRIYLDFYQKQFDNSVSNKSILLIFNKIAQGLYFLNSRQVLHRDLKPDNILADERKVPKIIDFGSSTFANKATGIDEFQSYPFKTTRFYNKFHSGAPFKIQKQFSKKEYERHQFYDIYAFGRLLQIILKNQILKFQIGNFLWENLLYLSNKCIQENPSDRLSPTQIIMFIKYLEICNQKLYQKLL